MDAVDLQQIKVWINDKDLRTEKELEDKPLRLKDKNQLLKIEIHDSILYVKRVEKK